MWTRLQRRNGWCPKKKSDGSKKTNQRPVQRNGGSLILNIFDKCSAGLIPFFFFFFIFTLNKQRQIKVWFKIMQIALGMKTGQ